MIFFCYVYWFLLLDVVMSSQENSRSKNLHSIWCFLVVCVLWRQSGCGKKYKQKTALQKAFYVHTHTDTKDADK
jgi:hypothetical protein